MELVSEGAKVMKMGGFCEADFGEKSKKQGKRRHLPADVIFWLSLVVIPALFVAKVIF